MPVTARLVVVAEVPVAFTNVKFCRVEEAEDRKPPVRVERPATESVPLTDKLVGEKLVALKLVAKKFVVVAEVEVEFKAVKF